MTFAVKGFRVLLAATAIGAVLAAAIPTGASAATPSLAWVRQSPATSPAAGAAAEVGLLPFTLKREDVPGFRAQHPFVPYDLSGWLDHLRYEGQEREEAEARLLEEGWTLGASQKLTPRKGTTGEGFLEVDEFKTAAGARREMDHRLEQDLAPEAIGKGTEVRHFRIHGAGKAKAFEFVREGRARRAEALLLEGPVLLAVRIEEPAGGAPPAVAAAIEAILGRR